MNKKYFVVKVVSNFRLEDYIINIEAVDEIDARHIAYNMIPDNHTIKEIKSYEQMQRL